MVLEIHLNEHEECLPLQRVTIRGQMLTINLLNV